ncbi:SRPBCC family protein [Psychromicrobium xiongbiense]|uniref:SRPBCC family protein n=1 Tax=Psychromicrobium xiongbiense TaxID=3051184 RepID=UPI0025531FEA|nr:SRPBCC domain-containing protein [Psychromicrobium sp. YIM S02556]
MSRTFDIRTENHLDASPEVVWDAVTTGNAGWLWPMEVEPRQGGSGPFGSKVTAWEPPRHFANHLETQEGFYNTLDYGIEPDGDGAWIRYQHAGIFLQDLDDDQWANQYDGVRLHTDFYQHTLGQYVKYFPGRSAAFAEVRGPEASGAPDAFLRVLEAVKATENGVPVSFQVPGKGLVEGTVDYLTDHFLGVRTSEALYRFFGRNAFGDVVGLTVHEFGEGAQADGEAWQEWLNGLYAA